MPTSRANNEHAAALGNETALTRNQLAERRTGVTDDRLDHRRIVGVRDHGTQAEAVVRTCLLLVLGVENFISKGENSSLRNGVIAASGDEFMCGPLSVEYMTKVLSAMPIERLEHCPDVLVVVDRGVVVGAYFQSDRIGAADRCATQRSTVGQRKKANSVSAPS